MALVSRIPLLAAAGVFAVGLFAGSANAHVVGGEPPLTDFGLEMDGDANDNGDVDWESVYESFDGDAVDGLQPGDVEGDCTFINGDFIPANASTGAVETGTVAWKGGTKDFEDFGAWWNRDGSASQKSDLLHVAVVVWSCDVHGTPLNPLDDHLIMQAFGDRLATSGNTFLGLWALQNELTFDGNRFTSDGHEENDILTIVNFPGNVDPADAIVEEVAVYTWSPPGTIKNTIDIVRPFGAGVCNGTSLSDIACSIVNEGGESTPWPFQSNDTSAPADTHTRASFVEMTVDLTVATGDPDICIATGLVETRQSSSVSSLLDDLVLAQSATCGVIVTVQCDGLGEPNFVTGEFDYQISGIVSTTAGAIDDVVINRILPAPTTTADPDVDGVNVAGTGWGPHNFSSAVNPVSVQVEAIGFFGTNQATAQSSVVQCPARTPDGMITIDKDCVTCIVDNGASLGITVRAAGEVSNTGGEVPITGFQIVETAADTTGVPFIVATFPADFAGQPAATNGKLDPGEKVTYSFDYDPENIPGGALIAAADDIGTFDDTVELVNVTAQFGFAVTGQFMAGAQCFICVPGTAPDPKFGLNCDPAP